LSAAEVASRVGADPGAVGDPAQWEHWGSLLHSVKTGEPAPIKLRGTTFFEYLDTNPELAAVFNDAMTSMSAMSTDPVLAVFDFSGFRRIVDVGGGHGSLLAAVLQSAPDAHGVLFDLPSVVEEPLRCLTPPGLVIAAPCRLVRSSTRFPRAVTPTYSRRSSTTGTRKPRC
jgi:hypothetical protein